MSGDSQRNDEPDFLDDFVVEDIAGKNDDLDQLFEEPADGKAAKPPAPGQGVPDSDDVLFTDHTEGLNPSERFEGKSAFAEGNRSEWAGEHLELDGEATKAQGKSELEAAEEAFGEELGSLLGSDDDLSIDDKELELVDGPPQLGVDGISEIEQSGPFVLDEGEGQWQEQVDAAAVAPPPATVQREVAEGIWEAVKDPAMAEVAGEEANQATEEPGWEPLPESNVDQLSEVDEVEERVDDAVDPEELADHEGHDIYSGDGAPVLVGPRQGGFRRASGLVGAVAASLALLGLGALVVMRPEWIGLHLEPVGVQQVQIARPRIEIAMATPPAVPVQKPQLVKHEPEPPANSSTNPVPDQAHDPVATVPPPTGEQYGPPMPDSLDTPVTPVMPVGVPVAVAPDLPTATWPVATKPPAQKQPTTKQGVLVRIGDDTMLGEVDPTKAPKVQAVEGVLPGTRAFAQLHNGNYFIGSIKVASADHVTLRLTEGEVTLAADEIARLTALGSADYEALQKATSGFVRLTNSNKLVGGILSQIADDHVVLEFRSNRVILPKSVVGAVVQGEPEQEVRLEVTREEDDWVKSLVERQLGSERPAPVPSKGPLLITPPPPEKSSAPVPGGATPPASPATPATPPAAGKPATPPKKV